MKGYNVICLKSLNKIDNAKRFNGDYGPLGPFWGLLRLLRSPDGVRRACKPLDLICTTDTQSEFS